MTTERKDNDMPKTFRECDVSDYDLMKDAMRRWNSHLIDVGLTVHLRYVSNRDAEGEMMPALKHHGYPAKAVIKINSLADRQEGKSDCTITIDEYSWQEDSDDEKTAVLDHELAHIELRHELSDHGNGALLRDDLGRPKLKIRLHDFEHGGFHHIAERHGPASAEQQFISKMAEKKWVQGSLAFNR